MMSKEKIILQALPTDGLRPFNELHIKNLSEEQILEITKFVAKLEEKESIENATSEDMMPDTTRINNIMKSNRPTVNTIQSQGRVVGLNITDASEIQMMEINQFVLGMGDNVDQDDNKNQTNIRRLIDWLEKKESQGCEVTGGLVVYEKADGRIMQVIVTPHPNRLNEYKTEVE